MKLLTATLIKRFRQVGNQEHFKDPFVIAKFFTPDSNWTWYATEYDSDERLFFGLVVGFESEMGYFSLDELESVRGSLGLKIERDRHFGAALLSEVAPNFTTS